MFEVKGNEFKSVEFAKKLLIDQIYLSDEKIDLKSKKKTQLKFSLKCTNN